MSTLKHQLKQIYIYKTFKGKIIYIKKFTSENIFYFCHNNYLIIINLLLDIEMPIQIILAKMELYGFGLNKEHLVELNDTVNKLMANIAEQGFEQSGTRFNMQSTLEWAKVSVKVIFFNDRFQYLDFID